jgi:ATP-dependent Clp protease ATP-binding subunit ClpX
MENCQLQFSENALMAIAQKAHTKKVGARGLRSIVEEIMMDIMFDLPEQAEGTLYTVDLDEQTGKITPMKSLPQRKESA